MEKLPLAPGQLVAHRVSRPSAFPTLRQLDITMAETDIIVAGLRRDGGSEQLVMFAGHPAEWKAVGYQEDDRGYFVVEDPSQLGRRFQAAGQSAPDMLDAFTRLAQQAEITLFIEIKPLDAGLPYALLTELVELAHWGGHRIISFDENVLAHVHRQNRTVPLGLLLGGVPPVTRLPPLFVDQGISGFFCDQWRVTAPVARAAADLGMTVGAFVVNTPDEAQRVLRRYGLQTLLFTDRPVDLLPAAATAEEQA